MSKSHPLLSGVPQGSVLGPLVFLILISDIDENLLNSLATSFADDTRMLKHIIHETHNPYGGYKSPARGLKSNSKLNDDKFECMRYGPNLDIKEGTSYLTPHRTSIENKDGVKDLGVLMSSDCSFAVHIYGTHVLQQSATFVFKSQTSNGRFDVT